VAITPTSVLGKYRIVREIARSNDIVYEGVDPAMGRRVAIKECHLPQHLSGTQRRERIERFYREAKAAGTLTHPNIVTIYDVGEENDRHYIVMEYLEGHSLREIQQMQGALPLKESIEIALQLCDALGYAHSKGIVHRDVKPDNVHILPGGIIKLTDFGIARISQEPSITAHGQVFGTPSYMSPEQVASHTVDHRTDIFSLGICLYEMVTGRKPFVGDSVITITYNIMNIQPPMPVGVPPSLHIILQKALAKDVNLRYQNLGIMAQDLRAEKYSLETGNRTSQIPSGMPQQHGTLNTGTVPPEVSGIPAFGPGNSQYGQAPQHGYPQQGYPQQGYGQPQGYPQQQYQPNYTHAPMQQNQNGMRPETKDTVRLVGLILLVVVALGLVVWACGFALHRSQARMAQETAVSYLQQASAAYNNHDYETAARDYEQARSVLPGSPEAQRATLGLSQVETARAEAADRAGSYTMAENSYARALQLDPSNAAAYNGLGSLMNELQNPQSALKDWSHAIETDPHGAFGAEAKHNSAVLYLQLAQASQSAGDAARARDYWQHAADIDPGSVEAQTAINNLNTNLPTGSPGSPPITVANGQSPGGVSPPYPNPPGQYSQTVR
jgi:serine/threonine-protein kinase